MEYHEYCTLLREHYTPLHPHLFTLHQEMFVPSLVRAVGDGRAETLRRAVTEVHPGVYAFDMLRRRFCADLLEEIAFFERWCEENEMPLIRPNTMNNYGAVLDTFGFQEMLQQLMLDYVSPFAALFYRDVGGDALDSHHGFVVAYEPGKDVALDFHVDASDVTLNVCLGKEFTEGELFFRGVRCGLCQQMPWLPREEFQIAHVPGRAILHRGRHRHGALPITGGARYNLILWCNSSRYDGQHDRQHDPAFCGWPEPEAVAPGEGAGGR
jgi:hypothetical protein